MFDLALLEFTPQMDSEGSPICMPKEDEDIPQSEERLTAAGFGYNPDHSGVFTMEAVNLTFDSSYETRLVTKTTGKSVCYVNPIGFPLGITSGYSNCNPATASEGLNVSIVIEILIAAGELVVALTV
uniref:ZP domain-containing protein n=1 Tax=Angiostrongylus cantonensis TaxID=6313 RepID=A0A0K0DP63_ANGCA